MSKCAICQTDYYFGDHLQPDEPCWCGEMCRNFNFEDYPWREYLPKIIRFRIINFLYRLAEKLIPKELK